MPVHLRRFIRFKARLSCLSLEAGVAWVAFVILCFSQSRLLVLLWDIHSNMHTGFDSINLVIQKIHGVKTTLRLVPNQEGVRAL